MPEIWAGVDIGKEHHHCVVINAEGERLLSRRVLNDEAELLELIGDVLAKIRRCAVGRRPQHWRCRFVDRPAGGHGQPVAYLTGLAVHRASATYRGEGKTDAKDAFVIADQARICRDRGCCGPGRDRRRPAYPDHPAPGRRL